MGKRLRSEVGLTVLEVAVAMGCLALIVVSSTQAMLFGNRQAATSRLATAARAVVQRNIDTALDVAFQSGAIPAILAITPAAGTVYDDDGGGDDVVKIAVQENQTTVHTPGTLTRTVVAVANSDGADIRRVTFKLNYVFRGRTLSSEMTTLRALDD